MLGPRIFRTSKPLPALCRMLLGLLLVAACDDSSGPGCDVAAVGAITASAGTTPTIRWAADCPALSLAVYPTATGLPVWELEAGSRTIRKPVQYGVVPSGVTVLHAAEALTQGTEYGVLVKIHNGTDTLSAVGTFTP